MVKLTAGVWVLFGLFAQAQAFYTYESIDQMVTTGNLVDVAFHPNGDYALVVESNGLVFRIDAADWSFSQVTNLSNLSIRGVDFNPDGTEALIVGHYVSGNLDEGRAYRWDHETQSIALLAEGAKPGIPMWAVDFTDDGASALVVGWYQIDASGGALLAYDYDPATGGLSIGAATNAWGPTDASWQAGGAEALITLGYNEAEVMAYRPPAADPNKLLDTDYRGKGSNAQGVDHHPIDGFGVVIDGHQNALKWDWGWTKVDLNANLVGINFNADGSRALLVGRTRYVSGSYVGTVIEYSGVDGSFTSADFSDVSIPGFGAAPWGAGSNTYFNAVAFRPGRCEGLIVGNKGSGAPGPFAPIAHFIDIRGTDCIQPDMDGGVDDGDAGVEDADAGPDEDEDAGADAGPDEDQDAGVDAGPDEDLDAGEDDGGTTFIPCTTDMQCPAGTYCNGERCTSDCVADSDCPAPYECDARGHCVPPDADGGGEEADAGTEDGQTTDGGMDAGTDATGDPGSNVDGTSCEACEFDNHCSAGRYCRDRCCVADCFLDSDCPTGFTCGVTGRCRAEPEQVSGCSCGARGSSAPLGLQPLALLLALASLRRRRSHTR